MEGGNEPALLSIQPFQDGGHKREVVLAYDDWGRVISEFKQGRRWGEGDTYDSLEEEYNHYAREVGSCRNNFRHIESDKEDIRLEYHYGEDVIDYVGCRHEKGEIQ